MSGSVFFGTNSSLVCRLWRAGRSVSVTGNRRTGSAASARGASHLYYEYQAGSRSQDLCLHQHPAWVISRGFRGTTASHWWLLTESCSCFRKTLRSLRTVRMCFFCLFFYKTMVHHQSCGDMRMDGLLSGHWMCKNMYVYCYGWVVSMGSLKYPSK